MFGEFLRYASRQRKLIGASSGAWCMAEAFARWAENPDMKRTASF